VNCCWTITDIFRANSVIVRNSIHQAVSQGRADVTPVFISDVPLLFERRLLKLDVAMVTVSPPDRHGFCTLATNVDTALSAVTSAEHVIGELLRIIVLRLTKTVAWFVLHKRIVIFASLTSVLWFILPVSLRACSLYYCSLPARRTMTLLIDKAWNLISLRNTNRRFHKPFFSIFLLPIRLFSFSFFF